MKFFKVRVIVMPREGLLDPQGKTVEQSLKKLGFKGLSDVRMGKVISLKMAAENRSKVEDAVKDMCRKLLANPVTEDYFIEID